MNKYTELANELRSLRNGHYIRILTDEYDKVEVQRLLIELRKEGPFYNMSERPRGCMVITKRSELTRFGKPRFKHDTAYNKRREEARRKGKE